MTRKRVYALVASLTAVAAVALLLAFVVIPGSSTGVTSVEVAAAPTSPSEGIAVHGHWTVDVLNPDGSLAEHREFENSFTTAGKEVFTNIIARQSVTGRYSIVFNGTPTNPCLENNNNAVCSIAEAVETINSTAYFKNLTVTKSGAAGNAKLVLSGSATIANTTSISGVGTDLGFCNATVSPANCANTASNTVYAITWATLSPTIAVQAGQQVQVTVEISFVI
jgi:hypothetical protein